MFGLSKDKPATDSSVEKMLQSFSVLMEEEKRLQEKQKERDGFLPLVKHYQNNEAIQKEMKELEKQLCQKEADLQHPGVRLFLYVYDTVQHKEIKSRIPRPKQGILEVGVDDYRDFSRRYRFFGESGSTRFSQSADKWQAVPTRCGLSSSLDTYRDLKPLKGHSMLITQGKYKDFLLKLSCTNSKCSFSILRPTTQK